MALAGLWKLESRRRVGQIVHHRHDDPERAMAAEVLSRMPVILPPETWSACWAKSSAEPDDLKVALGPYTAADHEWPVTRVLQRQEQRPELRSSGQKKPSRKPPMKVNSFSSNDEYKPFRIS